MLPKRFYEFSANPALQQYREREGHHDGWAGLLSFHSAHALDRIKERYNVSVTGQDWERLNWAIFRETGEVKFLFVKNPETTVYQVGFEPYQRGRKRTLNVMFSETAFCITTAVPQADIRVEVSSEGGMTDLRFKYSPLLKRRYEILLAYQNKKFGYNHGKFSKSDTPTESRTVPS